MSSQASPGAFVDAVEEMREPTILQRSRRISRRHNDHRLAAHIASKADAVARVIVNSGTATRKSAARIFAPTAGGAGDRVQAQNC